MAHWHEQNITKPKSRKGSMQTIDWKPIEGLLPSKCSATNSHDFLGLCHIALHLTEPEFHMPPQPDLILAKPWVLLPPNRRTTRRMPKTLQATLTAAQGMLIFHVSCMFLSSYSQNRCGLEGILGLWLGLYPRTKWHKLPTPGRLVLPISCQKNSGVLYFWRVMGLTEN